MSNLSDHTTRDIVSHAKEQLDKYQRAYTGENPFLVSLVEQLETDGIQIFSRKNMRGHITTSALVYGVAHDSLLLVQHRVLNLWLQPGGHHEGMEWLYESAAREAREEAGVSGLALCPRLDGSIMPIDVESHSIPANDAKGEEAHFHHDFLYLFTAPVDTTLLPQVDEVLGARWVPRSEFVSMRNARFKRLDGKLTAWLGR